MKTILVDYDEKRIIYFDMTFMGRVIYNLEHLEVLHYAGPTKER